MIVETGPGRENGICKAPAAWGVPFIMSGIFGGCRADFQRTRVGDWSCTDRFLLECASRSTCCRSLSRAPQRSPFVQCQPGPRLLPLHEDLVCLWSSPSWGLQQARRAGTQPCSPKPGERSCLEVGYGGCLLTTGS